MEQTNLKDRISKALALSTEKIIEKAERGEILSPGEHIILAGVLVSIQCAEKQALLEKQMTDMSGAKFPIYRDMQKRVF